jgi:arsenate reductase (thioredoxin)
MRIAELARRAGVAPSAVRWYEREGVLPAPPRRDNGYRAYAEADLARLRLVVALRRLGLDPADAGRLARLCLEQGEVHASLAPLLAQQRAAISRQRDDLDRLEAELRDLETAIAAAGRSRAGANQAGPIRVLFVCLHNSGRSQIAEALLREYGGPRFHVSSAGTDAGSVHPLAVRVLAEIGIDWSGARSKPVAEFADEHWDYVITVCDRARQRCPVSSSWADNAMHWGLDDPADAVGTDDERLAAFRRTREELAARLRPFVEVARQAAQRSPQVA